jgi:hypothetical protein
MRSALENGKVIQLIALCFGKYDKKELISSRKIVK